MLLFLRCVQQDSHEHLLQSKFQVQSFFFKENHKPTTFGLFRKKMPIDITAPIKTSFSKKNQGGKQTKRFTAGEWRADVFAKSDSHFQGWGSKKKKAGWGWLLASLLVNDGSFRLLRVRKRQRKKKTAKCKNQSLPYYQMNTNRTQIKKRKKK